MIFERAEESEARYREPVSKRVNVSGPGDNVSSLIEPFEGEIDAASAD